MPARDYAKAWRAYNGGDGCPTCGLMYVRESEEDRRLHRSRHRKVLQVYEPKPDPRLADLHAKHGAFVPIANASPRALRNRLEDMATMFRRELGFDFPPYSADEHLEDGPDGCHWLIVTPDGRPIGGLSARWREYSDAPAQWVWAWVWVIPAERRRGHVGRCWAMLRAQFSAIEPEGPFSYPVARFFCDRADISELTRRIAVRDCREEQDE
jgi:hypothetical protein